MDGADEKKETEYNDVSGGENEEISTVENKTETETEACEYNFDVENIPYGNGENLENILFRDNELEDMNTDENGTDDEYNPEFPDYEQLILKRNRNNKGIIAFAFTFCAVLIVTISAYLGYLITDKGIYSRNYISDSNRSSVPSFILTSPPDNANVDVPESPLNKMTIPQIAEKVGPCVVGIKVYKMVDNNYVSGQGSGVIMSSDGYIISNAHVFFNDDQSQELVSKATVVLSDTSEYDVKIIGIDPKTDLAVIKINASGLPCAEFGDSSLLSVGDDVVAIGNPGGMQFFGTVTNGIVSGMNRTIYEGSYATTFIQTNAAINPGNSGGALVNQYGQVIGINSAKIAKAEYEGIGFAIPSAEAKPVIDDLITYGYVKGRVKLGITYIMIDENMSTVTGLPTGIQIKSIEEGMDIGTKGAKAEDIIVEVDGSRILKSTDILDVIKSKKDGDEIKLKIYRPAEDSEEEPFTFETSVVLAEDRGLLDSLD